MMLSRVARRAGRYVMTGGIAAAIDVGLFWVALRINLPILLAATLSFVVAAICNYTLTTSFVFERRPSGSKFLLFFYFAVVGMLLNTSLTVLLSNEGLSPVAAKCVGIGIAFLANFAMNALIVFRN